MLFREGNIVGGDGHQRLRKQGVQNKFSFSLRTTGSFGKRCNYGRAGGKMESMVW